MADVQLTYLQDLPPATLLQLADLFLVHQSGNEKSVSLSALMQVLQPLDNTLTALAGLTGAADKLPYFNGADTAALTALTDVGRDIIGKTTIADVLTYLGLVNFTVVQSTGQSTTSVMSQKATTDTINAAASVGISQTWQDVKSMRTAGVNYTNATGRPIVVSVSDGSIGSKFLSVDGVYVAYSAGDNADSTLSAIVPAGSTYLVSGTGTLLYWAELR